MLRSTTKTIALISITLLGIIIGYELNSRYKHYHYYSSKQENLRKAYLQDFKATPLDAFLVSTSNVAIELQVINVNNNPNTVLGLHYNKSDLPIKVPIRIPPRDESSRFSYQTIRIETTAFENKKLKTDELTLYFKNTHGKIRQETPVRLWAYDDPDYFDDDFLLSPSNSHKVPFFITDEATKTIHIKKGTWTLSNSIKIPQGYTLSAQAGTQLNLINKARLLSYSPLLFIGTKDAPIRIYSSNKSGQGIVVLNAGAPSRFEWVHFEGLSNIATPHWTLSAALNFYESQVDFSHCRFENNQGGDDFLNIVRTNFSIQDSLFKNSLADALDADFAKGTILRSRFNKIGNDAIDVSGSEIEITDVHISNVEDKAISAGERSNINLTQCTIEGAELGLTSKDGSLISGQDIDIKNSTLGIVAFQKKPEYEGGHIDISNVVLDRVQMDYLLEKGSSLKLNLKEKKATNKNVKKLLYGTLYGKKSG